MKKKKKKLRMTKGGGFLIRKEEKERWFLWEWETHKAVKGWSQEKIQPIMCQTNW
jgi:hypothetical protein